MTLVLVSAASMIVGAWIHARAGRRCADRRLGLLGAGGAPTAEARRAARLAELGEKGTYKTLGCGEILHVDYDRGVLTCARDRWHR